MKHGFTRLDLMIAYSCNLSCDGCISISDIKRDGVAKFEDISKWITKWSKCIEPEIITIFGGEPCLHPNLVDICHLVRRHWPNCTIRLITNGYLLNRFDPAVWFTLGEFEIQTSIHRSDQREIIDKNIKNILIQKKDWKVTQFKEQGHKQLSWKHKNLIIYKSLFEKFVVPYKKDKNKFLPWNSSPVDSYKICGSPNTPILYKGLLYKCPPVANIIDITNENWFGYKGYDVDDDLKTFIDNINKPETVCGQCPDQKQAVIINHLDKKNVKFRPKDFN